MARPRRQTNVEEHFREACARQRRILRRLDKTTGAGIPPSRELSECMDAFDVAYEEAISAFVTAAREVGAAKVATRGRPLSLSSGGDIRQINNSEVWARIELALADLERAYELMVEVERGRSRVAEAFGLTDA